MVQKRYRKKRTKGVYLYFMKNKIHWGDINEVKRLYI